MMIQVLIYDVCRSPVLKLFSFLYPKSKVQAHVSFSDGNEEFVPEVSAAWTTIVRPSGVNCAFYLCFDQ